MHRSIGRKKPPLVSSEIADLPVARVIHPQKRKAPQKGSDRSPTQKKPAHSSQRTAPVITPHDRLRLIHECTSFSKLIPSPSLFGVASTDPVGERLGLIDRLESLIRESLVDRSRPVENPNAVPAFRSEPIPSATQAPTALQAPPTRAKPSRTFQSKRPEYQSALSDRSLVDALLTLDQTRSRSKKSAAQPQEKFSVPKLPVIEATQKKINHLRRSSGVIQTSLKS